MNEKIQGHFAVMVLMALFFCSGYCSALHFNKVNFNKVNTEKTGKEQKADEVRDQQEMEDAKSVAEQQDEKEKTKPPAEDEKEEAEQTVKTANYPNHYTEVDFSEQGVEEMKKIVMHYGRDNAGIVDGFNQITFSNPIDMYLFGFNANGFWSIRQPSAWKEKTSWWKSVVTTDMQNHPFTATMAAATCMQTLRTRRLFIWIAAAFGS